ncbi:MAG: hypothetical protein AVDCRST_MAG49-1502 [uncultured Thermomicrobiales bacterium]|uniref:Uncharacterized protein n=1 Tax=uncultured Thermomicrobiales bacterium TaxID=1645740 RepID=A0A6J4UDR8_9BACT|nr:MAG: hypothetical protein AVDCRST_MAG49-1502 [uncultured Thermomicrobiales bacterium]
MTRAGITPCPRVAWVGIPRDAADLDAIARRHPFQRHPPSGGRWCPFLGAG